MMKTRLALPHRSRQSVTLGAARAVIVSCAFSAALPQTTLQQASPLPDPTTAFLEKMNERQRVHSRLFAGQSSVRLLDELQSVEISAMPFFSGERFSQEDFLRRLMCSSDAAFVGVITLAESFPTQSGTFLFTEYTLRMERVFRQRPNASSRAREPVILVRLGGTLRLEGKQITASHNAYPPLHVNSRYLIFATYIPETGAFKTSDPDGAFYISTGRDSEPYNEQLPRIQPTATFEFLEGKTLHCS